MYLRNFEFGCQDYSKFSLWKFACIIPKVKVKGKLSNMVQVTDIVNLTSLLFKERIWEISTTKPKFLLMT